jgi:hypothetical protein
LKFRRWFDRYCQGQLPWLSDSNAIATTPPPDRRQILDRYHQHTQHCQSCRNALKLIRRLQWGLLAYWILSVIIVVLLPDQQRFLPGLPLLVIGLFGLGVAAWLKFVLEPQFDFVDYIHAERS